MRRALAASLALALASSAFAAPLPPRRQEASWRLSPFSDIENIAVGDLNDAIATAKSATPPDTDGVQCYTSLLQALQLIQANGGPIKWPPQLVNDTEKAWILHSELANLKSNTACMVVCGRASTMLAIYGVAVGQVCTALSKLP